MQLIVTGMGRELDFDSGKEVGTLSFNKGLVRITIEDKELNKILDFYKLNPIKKKTEEIDENIVLDNEIDEDYIEEEIEEPSEISEDGIMELE